jgi:hypothetical protein
MHAPTQALRVFETLRACLFLILLTGCGFDEPASVDQDTEQLESIFLTHTSTSWAATTPSLPFPLCPGSDPIPVTSLEVLQAPELTEPAARQPFRDPVFGTCLVRVTDRHADLAPSDSSTGLKNEYSRVQAFNADGSRILVRGTEATWYLYDARSLQPLTQLPLGNEPRWDGHDPNLIYYTEETSLFVLDLCSLQTHLVHNFAGNLAEITPASKLAAVWTRYEGSPSWDSRYWGLMAENKDWLPVAFLVYDKEQRQVSVLDLRQVPAAREDVDHVTMSPLGTYLLASFDRACSEERLGNSNQPCGLMRYDRDFTNGSGLLRIVGHYDTALDTGGREVIVYQDIDADSISMLDLDSGAVTALWPIDFSHSPLGFHFSGVSNDFPGWALISTYSGGYPTSFTWMDNQIFAIELKAGGRVVRLTHTHSIVDPGQEHDYWAEPHASVNRDFTRLVFTSNWGRSGMAAGTPAVEMYLVELPAGWDKFDQP